MHQNRPRHEVETGGIGRSVACAAVALLFLVAAPAGWADEHPYPQEITCEGDYSGHLQGVCTDGAGSIFWSYTTDLVKTDREGKLLKHVPTLNHHGDASFHDGKVYIAVNLGRFNDPEGNADSWVYVYDPETLELREKHAVPEVFHGAGGIAVRDSNFFVVGGLPESVEENYVYEYDKAFTFVEKHVVASGWTHLGIQTAAHQDGAWWFGCYGSPRVLLKTDGEFNMLGRYHFDAALGIVGVAKDVYLVAKGPKTPAGRHLGTLHLAKPDPDHGMAYLPDPEEDGEQ